MEEHPLTIPIDKIKNDFHEFLNPEHNRRIIFSGPFGIGKTYFLNEFFKEKDEEFYSIFLRPVNYSLLSNEDVFKLIKYDILTQIIQDENFIIEDEFDFSNTDYLKYFLSENRFLILRNLLKAIPKIRNVIPAAEELEKLFSKYQEGIEEINKNPNLELLKEFQQESESNFLLEYDEVSDFISSQLDELAKLKKEGESKLKKVLVIDDLDRLDPEHIFRLFNVFSAHFDQVHYYENSEDNDNKFGFDKIIFVCDIENIRKIFTHKYGDQVDFSGYIDKFYSLRPFYINNTKFINCYINKGLKIEGVPEEVIELIRILISYFFMKGKISLRTLENLFKEIIPENKYDDEDLLAVDESYDVKAANLNWIRYFSAFKPIFGKYSSLLNEIENIGTNSPPKIDELRFKKIQTIIINTYSILNTGHIKTSILNNFPANQNQFGGQLKFSFGKNSFVSYLSFQRKDFRYLLYDVQSKEASLHNEKISISELKSFYLLVIKAGLKLSIISD